MTHSDYIPRPDSQFDPWLLHLKDYVTEKTSGEPPAWAHIPAAEVSALAAQYTAWHTAFEATVPPHAKPQTDAKNAAREAAEAFVRPFVNQYLRFKPVTDSDRDEMGIHNRSGSSTPVARPDSPPDWAMHNNGLLKLRIEIRPQGAANAYIPDGYNGAVVYYAITDEPVTDITLLVKSALLNKGLSDIQLGPEADGKYFSATLEWETHTNLHGPKSAIQSIKVR